MSTEIYGVFSEFCPKRENTDQKNFKYGYFLSGEISPNLSGLKLLLINTSKSLG